MLDLESLNQKQQEAVRHGCGPLLVLAGPGSGKTFTITQHIFYLLEKEKIEPEKILVITFTKDAAVSMQNRFFQLSQRTLPVNFGTFHSVFYHILRESHFFTNKNATQILTEGQKKKLILPLLKKYMSKEDLQYRYYELAQEALTVLLAISYYKNTGDEKSAGQKMPEELQIDFKTIFQEYEHERRKRKAIDFDDMVYECRRLLYKDHMLKEQWQKRFSHILVDEFQDINPMQYEVLRLLSAAPYNIFAVGDDDQAIYGFRGSKPASLRQFVNDYNAKQIFLNTNYRSLPEIINASIKMIEENKDRFPKQLIACSDNMKVQKKQLEKQGNKWKSDIVKLSPFEEREEQYQYLVDRLKENCLKDVEGEERKAAKTIGVLFRTNAYMQSFATRLSKEGVPYVMKEKIQSIYEHFIVKDVSAYIRTAMGIGTRREFLQIMNRPSRYISREAVGQHEKLPQYKDLLRFYRQKGLDSYNMQVIWCIEKWQQQMKYLAGLSPLLAVQYIRKVVGYESFLKHNLARNTEEWCEWEELLDWLTNDAAKYKSVQEWFDAQEQYGKKLEQEKKDIQNSNLYLMTVHASKGLEFDKVYIPDCNEKIFPHGNMPDEMCCEEERRLFYVAMTRAKKSLELLYLIGTKERPRIPSRFLNRLFKDYSSTNSSNSQLSKYSSKASATFSYSSSSSM